MLRAFSDFVEYCRKLRGKELRTAARSKPFSVVVEGGTLWFVPESSGARRRADKEKTERVLKLLAESKDWSPGSYQAITFHASYILAVAKQWQVDGKP